MKEVLSAKTLEEAQQEEIDTALDDDAQDQIRKSMEARGKQENLSFFAFTATPKSKTIEVFGTREEIDGVPKPCHLYSMKQAIQEGFILDVLENYITYKTYFKLTKKIVEDLNVNAKQAKRAIARFLTLHPHNLAQKTEVMIEHFRQQVAKKIGGKAKAMVVTSSRLHAVKYKEEFDKYIKEKGYNDIKTLVAFSGKVISDSYTKGITESEFNGFKDKELPDQFGSDDYQVLIVASKYQTGFDQPLLHTMYVDKKLSGVLAVQTLSRLNRIYKGKEDTFVLDFVNEKEAIFAAFQPYYELTTIKENSDPNHLYDLKTEIESAQVIWESEVNQFCNLYFKSSANLTKAMQSKLNAYIDPAVERFIALPDGSKEGDDISAVKNQEDFKHALQVFIRTYSFLTQIIPFHDIALEKLFIYGRFLLKKIPYKKDEERFILHDEVALEYYRLEKIKDKKLTLYPETEGELSVVQEAGIRYGNKKEELLLSEIIELLNTKFQTDFEEADRLFFNQIEEDCVSDEKLKEAAKNNTEANFKYVFDEAFMDIIIERMSQNQDIFAKIMDNNDFGRLVKDMIMKSAYKRLTQEE